MAGLTLIFALFAAPAALATFPGKNGQILFTRLLFRDPSAEDDDTERFSLGVVHRLKRHLFPKRKAHPVPPQQPTGDHEGRR